MNEMETSLIGIWSNEEIKYVFNEENDGMYSHIITEKGDLVYYAAFAECQLVSDEDDEYYFL
jgi:heat shock protein HspQ